MLKARQGRRGVNWYRWMKGALLGPFVWCVACDSAEVSQCREQYMKTHGVVNDVDTTELKSVEEALALVNPTLEVCKKANLAEEQDQLVKVQRKLESHQAYLQSSLSKQDLTSEELAKLVKEGDPNCPTGTSYMYAKTQKQVRCKGPQVIDMNWSQASEYFKRQSFKLKEEGTTLEAEKGSVSYTFRFSKAQDEAPATCVKVFSPPGIAWQETASRVTGERPRRIKEDKPIKTASGEKQLKLIKDEVQAILEIGDCG